MNLSVNLSNTFFASASSSSLSSSKLKTTKREKTDDMSIAPTVVSEATDEVMCVGVVKSPSLPSRVNGRKRNLTDYLMDGAIKQSAGPFHDVLSMNITNFFILMIQKNLDLNNTKCFGPKTKRQTKEKAKRVWSRLTMTLGASEMAIITRLRLNRPANNSELRGSWMEECVSFAKILTDKMVKDIDHMIVVYNEATGKTYRQRKKTNTVGVVSTIVYNYWTARAMFEQGGEVKTKDPEEANSADSAIEFGDGHLDRDEDDDDDDDKENKDVTLVV